METRSMRLAEPLVFVGFLAVALLLLLVSYDAAVISGIIFLFVIMVLFRRERMVGWLPAILISGIWILASGDMYSGYNTFRLTVLGVSLFPILAWPLFLVLGYAYVIPFIRIEPWHRRWLTISVIWCVCLIFFEWLGYHVLGIHLDHGRTYKGWPILDIFHSPVWMQVTYFGNGILYYGVGCWLDRGTVAGYARAQPAL